MHCPIIINGRLALNQKKCKANAKKEATRVAEGQSDDFVFSIIAVDGSFVDCQAPTLSCLYRK